MKNYVLLSLVFTAFSLTCQAAPLRIVALGDSLISGYGILPEDSFPKQLQEALREDKYDVTVENAGVTGDTSAGGLARLEKSIAGQVKPNLVLVELGANDMLQGIAPQTMEDNLRQVLTQLKQAQIPALLIGMNTPLIVPGAQQQKYNDVFPRLAKEFNLPLYPFFLKGIVMDVRYNLEDGIHPNQAGVAIIVKKILPDVEDAIDKATGKSSWHFFGL